MTREIDEKAKHKALSRIARAKAAVERAIAQSPDNDAAETARIELTEWEDEFITSVEERLNTFGSAYANQELGAHGEALSRLQLAKLKEIERKAKGKPRKGFKLRSSFKKKSFNTTNERDIWQDISGAETAPDQNSAEQVAPMSQKSHPPGLRLIKGGKDD